MADSSVAEAMPSALHMLVWDDQPEELDKLLERTSSLAVVNPKGGHVPYIDHKYRGMSALSLAAQLGRQRCVEVLLKHWADTLSSSDLGYYPLQDATALGNRDLMRMILLRRHEQLRQIWKIRQPFLANALHQDIPDFFLEMRWHFKSWLPFLSLLCPSDTYRIWKRGNHLRADTTLLGFEKLSWIRGNVSYLFNVKDQDSEFFIVDHDRHLYEQVDKTEDFTEENIEDDLNTRLNTELLSGKVRKPVKMIDGRRRVPFVRQKSGLFGLGHDREEMVGEYRTRVFDVPNIEVVTKTRKEHLKARPNAKVFELLGSGSSVKSTSSISSDQNSTNNSPTPEQIREIESMTPQVEGMLEEARKNLYTHVPSLPPPSKLPSVSAEEFFVDPQDDDKHDHGITTLPYLHVGRPIVQAVKTKKFRLSVWMADNFPLSIEQLLPLFEILTLNNKHFEKLQEFIETDLPSGFPVQIEIPIFAFLTAQVTFLNFKHWDQSVPPPQHLPPDQSIDKWFFVPPDYKPGVVIKNILRKYGD